LLFCNYLINMSTFNGFNFFVITVSAFVFDISVFRAVRNLTVGNRN
jgi:hypothetical protein